MAGHGSAALFQELQMSPYPFDAVLFDCDGVLVDSEPLVARVLSEMLTARGWPLTPAQAAERVRAGTLLLVDVRPLDERLMAEAPVPYRHLDHGVAALEALPKDTALAFLCHSGGRSAQAAEHFRALGFTSVFNVAGGISAWALLDPTLPRY